MQDQNPLNPDLNPSEQELERALSMIRPANPSLDRDELMFRAGARSARGAVRCWQSMAALLAIGVGVMAFLPPIGRMPPQIVRRTTPDAVYVPVVRPDVPGRLFTAAAMQQAVLARGLDALPGLPSAAAPAPANPGDATPSLRPSFNLNPTNGDPS